MRSEEEILKLVLDTARDDERIRAVIMNGSRVNPNARRDIFQDFDFIYIVTDVAPFRHNLEWIGRFGEIMIMQLPEDMQDPAPDHDGSYSYLMQFNDGNRIDLGIFPLTQVHQAVQDSLSVLLLDKDGIIGTLPPASERDYLPKPPTTGAFADCCSEFWWVCPYVAKGLWRQEIPYARYMLDQVVREQLMKMLMWHIGVKTGFMENPGKFGKYFQKYLEPALWELFLATYSDAEVENTWNALESMCSLFGRIAVPVAQHFGFSYPHGDEQRVRAHLEHVRLLPREAQKLY
jgi:aminoglycoside 6-adenylyltransferase